MLKGDLLLKILIIEYTLISLAYFFQGNFAKGIYFIGAIIISLGVLWS